MIDYITPSVVDLAFQDNFSIYGSDFGATQNGGVVIINDIEMVIVSWSDTLIICTGIPRNVGTYDVAVYANKPPSAEIFYLYKSVTYQNNTFITGINPSMLGNGNYDFTIYGKYFGLDEGQVKIRLHSGGLLRTCIIKSWSYNEIVASLEDMVFVEDTILDVVVITTEIYGELNISRDIRMSPGLVVMKPWELLFTDPGSNNVISEADGGPASYLFEGTEQIPSFSVAQSNLDFESSRNEGNGIASGDIASYDGMVIKIKGETIVGTRTDASPQFVDSLNGDYGDPSNPFVSNAVKILSVIPNLVELSYTTPFEINGEGFGDYQGSNGNVTLAGSHASIISWSNNQIIVSIDYAITITGSYNIIVNSNDGGKYEILNMITYYQPTSGGEIPVPSKTIITNAVSYSPTINKIKWEFVPLSEWYDIYRDDVKINTSAVSGIEYLDETVNANITYSYTVIASNRSGSSEASDPYTVETLTDNSKTGAISVNKSIINSDSEITRT